MRIFYNVLANNLATTLANFFVWFAVIFWAYLETESVLTTSIAGGVFMAIMAASGIWFGTLVDRMKKKRAMLLSSTVTLGTFVTAFALYLAAPDGAFSTVASPYLWAFIGALLIGVIAGNIRAIATATLVTILVPDDRRDRMNGLSGMIMGISSSGAGIGSGFALAYAGMFWVLVIGLVVASLALLHLLFVSIPEPETAHHAEEAPPKHIDLRSTIAAIVAIPGLFALIFFTTFNNFLGGVFMALMDPYGLSLMPVEAWGTLWGVLSFGFIFGGLIIARRGLGSRPLRTLFAVTILMWIVAFLFPIQPSIMLLAIGVFIWTLLVPFIEATEHTIIQKVVPLERQGRVFGFAQSVETAASPITALLIGPIAQFIFIPFMTTGAGVELIGDWFGTGPGRGMALVFMAASVIGLIVTLIVMRLRSFKLLSERYEVG